MKPKIQMASAFLAGVLVCVVWYQFTATRYTISEDKYGRKTRLNQRTGETWWLDGSNTWRKHSDS